MLLGHDRHPNGEHIQQNFGRRKVGVRLFVVLHASGQRTPRCQKQEKVRQGQFSVPPAITV